MTDLAAVVARILGAYSIQYTVIYPPQMGYRNSSFKVSTRQGDLNVIMYKTEAGIVDRIKRANAVGDFLVQTGLPARQTYASKIVRLHGRTITKYAAIYHYLPGDTIPWEAYTMKHIKALGEMMSNMHAALGDFTGTLPDATAEFIALNNRMMRYFANKPVARAVASKLNLNSLPNTFNNTLLAAHNLPHQPLHLDFVRGNILFDGPRITGIIDFEKSASGPIEYDVARTLAFLLVDCKYKPEPKIRKYFMQSGYIKRGRGVIANSQLLEQLINFFLFHDFYKFLRYNPYESLHANQHFMRTRDALLQRGLLSVK